jgi:hypothetical protein
LKFSRLIITFFLFVSLAFSQQDSINQIKEKAKADAKFDFRKSGWIKWGAGSLLMSWGGLVAIEWGGFIIGLAGPPIIASFTPVNVPLHREEELTSQTNELKEIYRLMYQDTFKKQRLKYTMLGPSSCLLVFLYFILNEEAASSLATCFAPGTDIMMANGSQKNIEAIEVGDIVLSYNLETMYSEPDEVLELYSPMNDNMMEMRFSDRTIIHSTFDHPYFVKEKGWCSLKPDVTKELITSIAEVSQLEVGDICYILKDGELAEVEFIGSQRLNTFQRTYTIKKLKKNNAFFAEGVLVGVETVKEN